MAISSFVDGVWISGASPPPASTAGLTLLQLSGVWITGAPASAPATAGFTFNQLSGVWISGSGEAVPVFTPEPVHPPGMRPRRAQILREDEEIMAIIIAFLEIKGR